MSFGGRPERLPSTSQKPATSSSTRAKSPSRSKTAARSPELNNSSFGGRRAARSPSPSRKPATRSPTRAKSPSRSKTAARSPELNYVINPKTLRTITKTRADPVRGGTKPNPVYTELLNDNSPSLMDDYTVADALRIWPGFATKEEADVAAANFRKQYAEARSPSNKASTNLRKEDFDEAREEQSETLTQMKVLYYDLSGDERSALRVWLQDQL